MQNVYNSWFVLWKNSNFYQVQKNLQILTTQIIEIANPFLFKVTSRTGNFQSLGITYMKFIAASLFFILKYFLPDYFIYL